MTPEFAHTGDAERAGSWRPTYSLAAARQMVDAIKCEVCARFDVPLREMQSRRRARVLARPRQLAMALAYELTPLSLPKVGELFGDRDHTTVLHAVRCVRDDKTLALHADMIRAALKAG